MTDPANPMTHDFWVPGRPTTKGRPRMGRGKRVFTPPKTLEAEAIIAEAYKGPEFEDMYVEVEVAYYKDGQFIFITELPHWDKPTLTGDTDNYLKLTVDALQKGGAFKNDRQVVRVVGNKMHGSLFDE